MGMTAQDSLEEIQKEDRQEKRKKLTISLSIVVAALILTVLNHDFVRPLYESYAKVIESLLSSLSIGLIIYIFLELFRQTETNKRRLREFRLVLLDKKSIYELLTDDSVDPILDACLVKHYDDWEVAKGVRRTLKRYRTNSSRHREDMREEVKVENFDERYYLIKKEVQYYLKAPSKLVFRCSFSGSIKKNKRIVAESGTELSWVFVNDDGDSSLPESCFSVALVELTLGNDTAECPLVARIVEAETITYTFRVPDIFYGQRVRLAYSMEVTQARYAGMYTMAITVPVKRITSDVQIRASSVRGLHAIPGFTSEFETLVQRRSPSRITVQNDGWILPDSELVFTWSEGNSTQP